MQVPGSVLAGRACAGCWRPFLQHNFTQQIVENVARNLCDTCATRMFPVMPPGHEQDQLIHLDAKAGLAEAERRLRDSGG